MDNGVNTNDVATLALAANAGRGYGYGGVVGGGGGYGGAPFAGLASNAVRMDRNSQQTEDQADCTRAMLGQGFDSIRGSFENQTRNSQFARVCDRISEGEFRNGDRLRDIEREINANAREAAKCCCEAKAETLAVENRLTNLIKDNRIAELEGRAFQSSQNAQTAAIIAEVKADTGGGHWPYAATVAE